MQMAANVVGRLQRLIWHVKSLQQFQHNWFILQHLLHTEHATKFDTRGAAGSECFWRSFEAGSRRDKVDNNFLRLTTCKEGILPGSLSYCCKCFPGGFTDLGDNQHATVFTAYLRHLSGTCKSLRPEGCLEAKPTWFYLSTCIGTNIQKAKPHVDCMQPDISVVLARAQDNFYHSDFPLLAQLLKLLLKIIGLKSTLTNLNLRIPQVTGPLPLCNKQPVKLHGVQSKIKFISNEYANTCNQKATNTSCCQPWWGGSWRFRDPLLSGGTSKKHQPQASGRVATDGGEKCVHFNIVGAWRHQKDSARNNFPNAWSEKKNGFYFGTKTHCQWLLQTVQCTRWNSEPNGCPRWEWMCNPHHSMLSSMVSGPRITVLAGPPGPTTMGASKKHVIQS